jgi:pantothenate kinase-related protein Tda10
MKILGVCGGIGSGKSTACKLMVDALGCVGRIGELCLSRLKYLHLCHHLVLISANCPHICYAYIRCRSISA